MAMEKSAILRNLGPLEALAGTWEGVEGSDVAPGTDRGTAKNRYRETLTLVPFGSVDNHEQKLFGLRYGTTAWRVGEPDAFHEETGYWLWDAAAKQVLRCFIVPRGITILAGGTVEPEAREFSVSAVVGSQTYGICSNLFLDREFRTVRYDLKITLHGNGEFSYEEDTQLLMPGKQDTFHHTDANRMRRVAAP